MNFNQYFDFLSDLSESDSENYNDSTIVLIDDMDYGPSFLYSLDKTKTNDEEYISNIEEIMDANDIKDYKIEDNSLIFNIK